MGFLNLKVSGQQKMLKIPNDIAKRIQNKRGANLAAVIVYERWIKKNFRASGKNHENSKFKWKPLKDSTILRRRKGKGKGGARAKILQDTGNLMLRWDRFANNKFGKLRSGVSYSKYHETGDRKANLPQRKIFPSDKQRRDIVFPVYEKFVKRATK